MKSSSASEKRLGRTGDARKNSPEKAVPLSICRILRRTYGEQKCFLDHDNPFQLLASAILSAQCTDLKVNRTTPSLFKAFPDLESFANADKRKLEEIIRPLGLYKAKAANIIASARKIIADFAGQVPGKMEDLTSLPGIGRKTANVVLGHAFGIPGFPVDTHVIRLSNRIGMAETDNPVKIEFAITSRIPKKYWSEFSLLLIQHGRRRCSARKPDCENCEIRSLCMRRHLKRV